MFEIHELHEMDPSHLVIGAGFVLVVAGIMLAVHQTARLRRDRRGRLHMQPSLRGWTLEFLFTSAALLAVGALLVGGGHFMIDH